MESKESKSQTGSSDIPAMTTSAAAPKRRADLSGAERVASQFAQEKAKREEQREREAERQVRDARTRQLKQLYAKGLSLYRQGDYQAAMQVLQQLALIDPSHELVKAGQRLMAQAETKLFEQRARAAAKL